MLNSVRWFRSDEGAIAGVCKGLAQALDLDVGVLRVLFVVFTIFGGCGILTYIALAISLPRKDRISTAMEPKVLGVCSRLSVRFEIEVGLVRFLAILSAGLSLGMTFIAYVVLYFLLPETSRDFRDVN